MQQTSQNRLGPLVMSRPQLEYLRQLRRWAKSEMLSSGMSDSHLILAVDRDSELEEKGSQSTQKVTIKTDESVDDRFLHERWNDTKQYWSDSKSVEVEKLRDRFDFKPSEEYLHHVRASLEEGVRARGLKGCSSNSLSPLMKKFSRDQLEEDIQEFERVKRCFQADFPAFSGADYILEQGHFPDYSFMMFVRHVEQELPVVYVNLDKLLGAGAISMAIVLVHEVLGHAFHFDKLVRESTSDAQRRGVVPHSFDLFHVEAFAQFVTLICCERYLEQGSLARIEHDFLCYQHAVRRRILIQMLNGECDANEAASRHVKALGEGEESQLARQYDFVVNNEIQLNIALSYGSIEEIYKLTQSANLDRLLDDMSGVILHPHEFREMIQGFKC